MQYTVMRVTGKEIEEEKIFQWRKPTFMDAVIVITYIIAMICAVFKFS